mgnify:CR=1 FL=1
MTVDNNIINIPVKNNLAFVLNSFNFLNSFNSLNN